MFDFYTAPSELRRVQRRVGRLADGLEGRGQGLGRQMIDWAVGQARARGCALVQLTSDQRRPEAHRFYEQAGFVPSHLGFKLRLDD